MTLMAERQGFEPWEGINPQRFSRPPHSTTLPPLQIKSFCSRRFYSPQYDYPNSTSRIIPNLASCLTS